MPGGAPEKINSSTGRPYLNLTTVFCPPIGFAEPCRRFAEVTPPARYTVIPADLAAGPGRNVAQAYARFASALQSGKTDAPAFSDAIVRHTLIDAMERSHRDGKVIKLA